MAGADRLRGGCRRDRHGRRGCRGEPAAPNLWGPPEDGAYSYTTTVGIRCHPAEKIAFQAVRKFCAQRHGCRYGIRTSPLLIRKGQVAIRGWHCHLREGYEFSDVRCQRRTMLIHHQSGA